MLEEEILHEIESNHNERPNEIIEIDENENVTLYDMQKVEDNTVKKKPKKKKKQSKWSMLDKKKKIIIIVCLIVFLLIIIGLLLYFLVFKKDNEDSKKPKEPMVIVEKDNYRYEDGKLIFIDENKKDIGSYECKNKDEDLCFVAYYSNEDEFDVAKHVYQNGIEIENRSDILLNNYALVYDNTGKENGKVKLYNIEEEKELGIYRLVKEVSEDTIILQDEENKYGVLKVTEDDTEELIEFKYDYIGYILESNNFVVVSESKYNLLDIEGKEVTKNIPGEIKNYSDKYISVVDNEVYSLYNYEGKKQLESNYDYIRFIDDYIVLADGRKLFIYDNELNPMNMDGIRIDSSNYNTKITFDESLKEVKRDVAFEVEVNDDNIVITYGDDETKSINIYEGLLSKEQQYISYFDGTLYIYQDEAKTTLLGSYKCTNPNVVEKNTKDYTNCYIAKEKALLNRGTDATNIGYLPIYNKRYLFVQDNADGAANDTIVLWDLKSKEKKATYTEVDAGFYNKNNVINFVDTTDTVILAKNTSNSYGIIRVEASELRGIISFKDGNDSIKYLNKNFLTKRSNGTYHLYDSNGEELTKNSDIKNEIVDYNNKYFQVKNNDKYMVYGFDGKIVKTDKELLHVTLYKDYFVGIDTNYVLGIYKYDGTVHIDTESGSKIEYKDDLSKSYIVENSDGGVKVQIFATDGQIVAHTYVVTL